MTVSISVGLDESSASELRRLARDEHRTAGEVGALMIEEGLRQRRFPQIEFRTVGGERHACLKGSLPVWQLVFVARDYGRDIGRTAEHLDLRPDQVSAGLAYYSLTDTPMRSTAPCRTTIWDTTE